MNQNENDPLKRITRSMTYTIPQVGDHVIKYARLIRICKNVGCAKPVSVASVEFGTGKATYHCPDHGVRYRNQMKWMDITGSTMLEFRKVGL